MIPPLKGTDTAAKAARLFDEFHVGQLPVLASRHYRGLVTEHDLADYEDPDTQLWPSCRWASLTMHSCSHDQHFYRVMELAIENKIQLGARAR
ncbi:MAG: CBS domain-containing protein [Hymenobacter sp.]